MGRARRGRGEGGVFQRKSDGLWVGTVSQGYDANGKRVRITVYGATKSEAMKNLAAARAGGVQKDRVTVAEFGKSWLEKIEGSVELGTWRMYEQHLRVHVEPRIGHVKLTALDAAMAAGFVSKMRKDAVSAAMIRKVVRTLRAVLATAIAAKIIPTDPVAGIPLPKHVKPEVRVLTPAEAAAFLSAVAGHRLEALFLVAIDSGLRQGELFALRWSDYDATTGGLTVTRSMAERKGEFKEKPVKTANGRRRVVLDFSRAAVDAHRVKMAAEGQDTKTGFMFCDEKGGALKKSGFARGVFEPARDKAGIDDAFTFHGLRHSSATLLLLAGIDTKTVSSRLGHGSAGFTANVYQHVLSGMQERAAGALAGVLNSAIGYSQATVTGKLEPTLETKNPPETPAG